MTRAPLSGASLVAPKKKNLPTRLEIFIRLAEPFSDRLCLFSSSFLLLPSPSRLHYFFVLSVFFLLPRLVSPSQPRNKTFSHSN